MQLPWSQQHPASCSQGSRTAHRGVVLSAAPCRVERTSGRQRRLYASAAGSSNGGGPGPNGSNGAHSSPTSPGSPAPLDPMNQHGQQQDWTLLGFPTYLHNTQFRPFPCEEPDESPERGGRTRREQAIWLEIRAQAQLDAASEPLLSSFMYASILAHDSFEKSLAFVLANRLANNTLLPTQLFEIFVDILTKEDDVRCGSLADLEAVRDRDPACLSLLQPLLYNKGYHAIQTHRIAHCLWDRGQRVMALALQSRSSEVFAVDIHPAARIGKGILLDHGTGVVIGETAVLGDNCSLLQNITLGGTGKDTGDRHPKIGDNVLIGANATVLGNIRVGRGAQIAAGSLVLKEVQPCTMVAGSPAKEVGKVQGNPAQTMEHWAQCQEAMFLLQQPQQPAAPAVATASPGITVAGAPASPPEPGRAAPRPAQEPRARTPGVEVGGPPRPGLPPRPSLSPARTVAPLPFQPGEGI